MFGRRQDVGQRDRFLGMEQTQGEAMRGRAGFAVETHAERLALQGRLQRAEVGHRLGGVETVAIDRGEPVAPAAGGGAALDFAETRLQGRAKVVAPRGRGLGERLLELGKVGRRRIVGRELQRVERLGERRIAADRGGDRGHLAVPRLLEDGGETVAEAGIEALARREHQAGGEAADGVAAGEQRHAPPLLQLQDAQRMVVERVLLDLEQLVARIGFEDRQQRLAVVAVCVEAGAAQDAVDPPAQQRHVLHQGVIGGGREQAGQAPLAGHPAVGVVGLHDHAVHRPDAMDQRRAVGLDDQDVLRPAREAGHRLAAAQPRLEQPHLVAAQDAQRGARDQLVAQAAGLRRIVDIAVAAMAEEGEMVGFQPAQEILVLGQVGRAAGRQVGDGVEAGAPHRPPVLDRQPHFGQHAGEGGGELVEQMGIGLAVDLDMHHRFGPRPLAGLGRDAQKVAVEVAPRRYDRMGQQVDGDLAAIELVGDRIDQERHVVIDDLHDGVAAFEAMVGGGGVEHPDLGDAGQAAAGEGEQGDRGGGALVGRGRRQILVGDAAEDAAGEMGGFLAAAGVQSGGADGIQPVNPRRQCDGHDAVFLPLAAPSNVTCDCVRSSAGTVGSPYRPS